MAEEQPLAKGYELVDIVQKPLGDMVMWVGNKESGTGNVRVHKSVMRMASPVFETMLGGEFAEATRTLDENDPLELEDNREALIVMCQVLHHQNHDAAAAAVILSKIIVVADKYNCLAGVLPGIMTPLRAQIPDLRQRLNVAKSVLLGNLMCGAYLAGDGFLLWQFSRVIAAQMKPATADKVFSCDEVLLKIIPSNLPESVSLLIRQTKSSIFEEVFEHVMSLVNEELDESDLELLWTDDRRDQAFLCQRSREIVGVCALRLATVRQAYAKTPISLLDLEKHVQSVVGRSLNDLLPCLGDSIGRTPHKADEPLPFSVCRCGEPWNVTCPCSYINPAHEVTKATAQVLDSMEGLCLACFKKYGSFVRDKCNHSKRGPSV